VDQVAAHYQSKDPLRWVFIALKLNVDRWPTERERKLFSRRVVRTIERTAANVTKAFTALGAAVTQAAGSIKTFTDNIKLLQQEETNEQQ
jgi:hypothetical protein